MLWHAAAGGRESGRAARLKCDPGKTRPTGATVLRPGALRNAIVRCSDHTVQYNNSRFVIPFGYHGPAPLALLHRRRRGAELRPRGQGAAYRAAAAVARDPRA